MAALALAVVILLSMLVNPVRRVNIHPDDVAAFRIPQRSIITLRMLSDRHALDFPQVLAVYSLENDFFPSRAAAPPPETIEHMFIQHYDMIRGSFRRADILRYEDIFRNLLSEIRFFPIPLGFDNEFEPSYMYGDSFDTRNIMLANPRAGGTNIFDRENVPGRIPVVAVASGTVTAAGFTNTFGYRIEILGERGTVFTYSHLYMISDGVRLGQTIMAGELLGSIGNTGFAGAQHARGRAPAQLRFTISPQTRLTLDAFYINPYPFLRLLEDYRIDLRRQWFSPAAPNMPPQPGWQQMPPPIPHNMWQPGRLMFP